MACGLVSETSHILIIMQRAGRGWCGNEREGEGRGRGGGEGEQKSSISQCQLVPAQRSGWMGVEVGNCVRSSRSATSSQSANTGKATTACLVLVVTVSDRTVNAHPATKAGQTRVSETHRHIGKSQVYDRFTGNDACYFAPEEARGK